MSAIKLSDGAVTRNTDNGSYVFNDTVSNNGDILTEGSTNVEYNFDAAPKLHHINRVILN